jgi:hypothetical protein
LGPSASINNIGIKLNQTFEVRVMILTAPFSVTLLSLRQPPGCEFAVDVIEQLMPALPKHGVLDRQIGSAELEQTQESGLDVSADEQSLRRVHSTMSFHHGAPGGGHIAKALAFANRLFARELELILKTHKRSSAQVSA